jgi:parallel beta-helix repeat protein
MGVYVIPKKCITILITCLLVLLGLMGLIEFGSEPVEAFEPLAGGDKTLYVGGSGAGNYSKIQDAIDNASAGDTVFVYNGTYKENITISISLNLIGEDKNNTIIKGNIKNGFINISANYVNVSGFNITDPGNVIIYDIGIKLNNANNCNIKDNLFYSDDGEAIVLISSSNNSIQNNKIKFQNIGVFLFSNSINNIIANNTILDHSGYGHYVGILNKESNHNLIINNSIFNNVYGICVRSSKYVSIFNNSVYKNQFGINVQNSSNVIIKQNRIHDNNHCGSLGWNIHLNVSSNNNTVSENTIFYESISGEGIGLITSVYNNISNNNISNSGFQIGWGSNNNLIYSNLLINASDGIILRDYSKDNFISNNTIIKIKGWDIYGGDGIYISHYCPNNNIISNQIFNSKNTGIEIYSSNNIITNNNISYNQGFGIDIYFQASNNTIYNNNFINNTYQARGNHSKNIWNSSYPIGGNYWSNYNGTDTKNGPNQNLSSSDGIGDTPFTNNWGVKDHYPLMKPLDLGNISLTYPNSPLNLKATSGDGFVNLSWTKPVWDGGTSITNYRIYRGLKSSWKTFLIEIGNNLFYNDTTITNNVTYYYQVTAKNIIGEGQISNEIQQTPKPSIKKTVPSKPRSLWAKAGNGFVNLYWSRPSSDGNSTIINYYLYRSNTTNSSKLYKILDTIRFFNDTNVTNNNTYYYRVSAVNSIGEGPLSPEISATPKGIAGNVTKTIPTFPRALSAKSGDKFVSLSWSEPIFDGNSSILNYSIYRGTSSNGKSMLQKIGNITKFNDTIVTNGITYYYEVSAINSIGEGPRSNEVIATPNSTQGVSNKTIPSHPLGVQANAGDGYVSITWSPPLFNGNSSITNYSVYRGNKSGELLFYNIIGKLLFFNDTNVNNGITYYYRLSAKNIVGEGPLSNEISATPKKPKPKIIKTVPTNPRDLKATSGDGFVELKWSSPNFDGNSSITNYKVYRGTSSSKKGLLIKLGKVLKFNDTNVSNGITYYYEVSAVNSIGESLRSNEAIATAFNSSTQNASQIQIPPTHPRDLTARAGDGFVNLSWKPPEFNGNGNITNYRIYKRAKGDNRIIEIMLGIKTHFNDTNVTNNITYYYRVSALNKIGEGALSVEVSATPRPPTRKTSPTKKLDSDNDGLPDAWELLYGLNITDPSDANLDYDNDNLTNLQEYLYNTDPKNNDTDKDNVTDWDEINRYGTNATNPDSDGDGYSDGEEIDGKTDPLDENDYPGAKAGNGKEKPKAEINLAFFLSIIIVVIIITLLFFYLVVKYVRRKEEI